MLYDAEARYTVEFVDHQANDRGIREIHEGVKGIIEAPDENCIEARIRAAIRQRYPVCWQIRIRSLQITPSQPAIPICTIE